MLVQQTGQQCSPDGDGRRQRTDAARAWYRVTFSYSKIFLICRDEKWESGVGENTVPEQKVILVVYFFRFGRRINSQINVTSTAEGIGFAGQPL